jgi:ABC-2 type transport system permease protein
MNTQSNAAPDSPVDSQGTVRAAMSRTGLLYWSIRREFWENRSLYIAPLAVAAVILFGFLISTFHHLFSIPDSSHDPGQHTDVLAKPYDFAALMLMGATLIVAVFYCLEAFHGERRDRSILFWKSLPVSDLTTVLSKASIPLLILPLITFVITVGTQLVMLLLSAAIMAGSGRSIATLTHLPLLQMSLGLFYHLLAMHGLWYAPFYGWLMLVSSWARRAAFLWAALPLLAIGVIEKLAFNTSHFAMMLQTRFLGGPESASSAPDSVLMDPLTLRALLEFLSSPGLWVGLTITAAFLAAVLRLRRYGEPI